MSYARTWDCRKTYIHTYIHAHVHIGGECSWTFGKTRVTHVICENLSGRKTHQALNSGGKQVKFVRPEWVIDSIQQNRCLSEGKYMAVEDKTMGRIDDMLKKTWKNKAHVSLVRGETGVSHRAVEDKTMGRIVDNSVEKSLKNSDYWVPFSWSNRIFVIYIRENAHSSCEVWHAYTNRTSIKPYSLLLLLFRGGERRLVKCKISSLWWEATLLYK